MSTQQIIESWENGVEPYKLKEHSMKTKFYNVYVSIAPLGKVCSKPLRFRSLKRARAYAHECQARLKQNTVISGA